MQEYDEIHAGTDGVEVDKRLDFETYEVPVVAFELHSGRDGPVSVRLEEPIPEGIPTDALGFHRDYGIDYWDVLDDRLVLAYTLDAGETLSTCYAVQGDHDVSAFAVEPLSIEVDPPNAEEGRTGEDQPSESDTSDLESSVPMLDGVDGEPADSTDVSATDVSESTHTDVAEAFPMDLEENHEEPTPNREDTAIGDGDAETPVLDQLLAEISESEDARLSELTAALDRAGERTSVDTRIAQLQADFADIRAYSNALESFLDENGTADQLTSELDDRVTALEADLESARSEVASNGTELASLGGDVDELELDVDEAQAVLEELESAIDAHDGRLDTLREEVPDEDVTAQLDDVQTDVETLREWHDRLRSAFGESIDSA